MAFFNKIISLLFHYFYFATDHLIFYPVVLAIIIYGNIIRFKNIYIQTSYSLKSAIALTNQSVHRTLACVLKKAGQKMDHHSLKWPVIPSTLAHNTRLSTVPDHKVLDGAGSPDGGSSFTKQVTSTPTKKMCLRQLLRRRAAANYMPGIKMAESGMSVRYAQSNKL